MTPACNRATPGWGKPHTLSAPFPAGTAASLPRASGMSCRHSRSEPREHTRPPNALAYSRCHRVRPDCPDARQAQAPGTAGCHPCPRSPELPQPYCHYKPGCFSMHPASLLLKDGGAGQDEANPPCARLTQDKTHNLHARAAARQSAVHSLSGVMVPPPGSPV